MNEIAQIESLNSTINDSTIIIGLSKDIPFTPVPKDTIIRDFFCNYEYPLAFLAENTDKGYAGTKRQDSLNHNDGVAFLIILCFIIVSVALKSASKIFEQIFKGITNSSSNSFDNNTTKESNIKFILLFQTFILEGIAIYYIAHQYGFDHFADNNIIRSILIYAAFSFVAYLFSLFLYSFTGFIFADKYQSYLWKKSFININCVLGILLFPVIVIMVYFPVYYKIFMFIIVILYVLTRIIFIYSGIKKFFRNIYSILYFILYLCTLEIAPILLIYKLLISEYSFVELKIL